MIPEVKTDFESDAMTPEELVQTYGTHFISSLIIGARLSYSFAIDSSDYVQNVDMSVAAKLSYNGLINKASGAVSAEQTNAANLLTEKSLHKARILGGDNTYVRQILEDKCYDKWRASVPDNMHVVDLYNGMVQITKLIEDDERRKKVQKAIDNALQNTKGPEKPYVGLVQSFNANNPGRWYLSVSEDGHPTGFGPLHYPGAAFYGFTEQRQNSVPIYRLKAEDPLRFMLSPNNESRDGWCDAEIAFYAYTKAAPDRVLVRSFVHARDPGAHGSFYNTNSTVDGWKLDAQNNFYAPKP